MELKPGQRVLDRYVVEGLIGEGGMGRVYRARHVRLNHTVALKVLFNAASPETAARFELEAQLMARVRHPNVVSILDYGIVSGGLPCIAMEYVEGEPLDTRLARRGALPWNEALEIIIRILSGLEAIHAASILHRDLKPGNVLVIDGEVETCKLLDFGIAKSMVDDQRLTHAGGILGTPAYMAPEQLLAGDVDERTDVWAAAAIFWELLTGRLPFESHTLAALIDRASREAPPPVAPPDQPAIPAELQQLIVQALAPAASARPPNARSFAQALRSARLSASGPRRKPESSRAAAGDPSAQRMMTAWSRRGTGNDHPAVQPPANAHDEPPTRRPRTPPPLRDEPQAPRPRTPLPRLTPTPREPSPPMPPIREPVATPRNGARVRTMTVPGGLRRNSSPIGHGDQAPDEPGGQRRPSSPSMPAYLDPDRRPRDPRAPEPGARRRVSSTEVPAVSPHHGDDRAPDIGARRRVSSTEAPAVSPNGSVRRPSSSPGMAPFGDARRAVIAARVPGPMLARQQTQDWLGRIIGSDGASLVADGDLWVAVIRAGEGTDLGAVVQSLTTALTGFFGMTARLAWEPVDDAFELPGSLTGRGRLPTPLDQVIARVSG